MNGVDPLCLAQAKMQGDPSKAALKLLGCLFKPVELVNGNPSGTTNSKDENRQKTIQKLDPRRIKYTEGIDIIVSFSLYPISN